MLLGRPQLEAFGLDARTTISVAQVRNSLTSRASYLEVGSHVGGRLLDNLNLHATHMIVGYYNYCAPPPDLDIAN